MSTKTVACVVTARTLDMSNDEFSKNVEAEVFKTMGLEHTFEHHKPEEYLSMLDNFNNNDVISARASVVNKAIGAAVLYRTVFPV